MFRSARAAEQQLAADPLPARLLSLQKPAGG